MRTNWYDNLIIDNNLPSFQIQFLRRFLRTLCLSVLVFGQPVQIGLQVILVLHLFITYFQTVVAIFVVPTPALIGEQPVQVYILDIIQADPEVTIADKQRIS